MPPKKKHPQGSEKKHRQGSEKKRHKRIIKTITEFKDSISLAINYLEDGAPYTALRVLKEIPLREEICL